MRRVRLSGVLVGLLVVAINIGLVVGLVVWAQGRPDLSTDASSSTTSEPTSTSSTSSTSDEPRFAQPSTVIAKDKDPFVVVLGGDEGAGETGWVQRMSTVAEDSRTVSYSALEPQDPTKYAPPTRSGSGKSLWIRNGSVADSSIAYATHRMRFLVPRNADVVVISYHPTSTKGLDRDLNDLLKSVRRQARSATVAIVLGPDGPGGEGKAVRTRQDAWAERNEVPAIDVHRAFSRASGAVLHSDWAESHLTEQGADLWARTVLGKLLGKDLSSSTTTPPAPLDTTTEPPPVETTTEIPDPVTTEPPSTFAPPPSTYVPPAPTTEQPYVPPPTTDPPEPTGTEPATSTETSTETSTDPTEDVTGATTGLDPSE